MWTAISEVMPELNEQAIQQLCGVVKVCIVHDIHDSCRANIRLSAYRSLVLPANCLHAKVPCVAHIAHLIMTTSPKNSPSEFSVIGDVYAAEFCGRAPAHYNRMLSSLRSWLYAELLIYDDGRVPSEANRTHLDGVLEMTVMRHINHVRGRLLDCDDPELSLSRSRAADAAEEACSKIRDIFNDDVRLAIPVHIRTEATQALSRDELVDAAARAVADAHILTGLCSQLPSKNRWGSMLQCLERQIGGCISTTG